MRFPKGYLMINSTIYVLFGLVVALKGPIYLPDSYAHMDMLINRSPVYSLFLKVFTSTFKAHYVLPLLLAQYSFLVLSIRFLLRILYKNLRISLVAILILQLIFLANGVYWYPSVNRVLSESLTFPMLLFFIGCLFNSLMKNDFGWLLRAIILLGILQFTRGQFVAFLPVLLLALVYMIYTTKNYKIGGLLIIVLALVPVIVSCSERVYYKLVFDQNKNYAMTYVHCISAPFYIAKSSDIEIFETEEQKSFFSRTFQILESKEITRDFAISNRKDDYDFFDENFTKICNASIHESNMEYYRKHGFRTEYEQQYKVDEVTTKMFFPLLKANFKLWFRMLLKSIEKGLGGRSGAFLTFMILCFSLVFVFKDNRFAFLSIAVILKLANSLIVAIAVHSIIRYTFYFDWIIGMTIVLLLDPILKKYLNVN